jgi:hypothetical protein
VTFDAFNTHAATHNGPMAEKFGKSSATTTVTSAVRRATGTQRRRDARVASSDHQEVHQISVSADA